MNGQLSEHPLAELISEISAKNLSGALRVARERVKAVIYFEDGKLTYATANLRSYRLAEYLQKRGLASAEQIAAVKNARSDFALAAALLSAEVLTRNALDGAVNEQVPDVLRMLLLWLDGEWGFDNRARLSDPTRVVVQTGQLLIESTRRMEFQLLSSRLRNPREVISPARATSNQLNLSPTEGFLLSRVEGPIEVGELAALSGVGEAEALRTIYGLVVAGFLQREFWPHAFKTDTTKSETVSAAPSSTLRTKETPVIETAPPKRDAKQELNEFLERLSQTTSHYEVLDLPVSAEVSEIRQAYHALARRFHPDIFHELAGTPLHARLESAFARITQANEILVNRELRAAYNTKLAALKRARDSTRHAIPWGTKESRRSRESQTADWDRGSSDARLAEKRFQEGLAALQMGQTNMAISSLSAAARLEPSQPNYRAQYGRALATSQRTRRLAEVELQAAVKLDATNATYRVMLAALYRDLGFYRRALAELERALALDSQNSEAREMLKTLELDKP